MPCPALVVSRIDAKKAEAVAVGVEPSSQLTSAGKAVTAAAVIFLTWCTLDAVLTAETCPLLQRTSIAAEV
jgi:hypothetical protein